MDLSPCRRLEAAGEKAETIAFLYCVIRRGSLYENLERGAPYTVVTREGSELPLTGVEQFAELLTLEAAWKRDQRVDTDMDMAIAKLKATEMLAMVADAYPAGITMGAGFSALLKKLLSGIEVEA